MPAPDRVGDPSYDVDAGRPHTELAADSGDVVAPCPVGHRDFGGGYSRSETTREDRREAPVVSIDAQPCVGCGTCAVVAHTDREHPRGGGAEFNQG